MYSTEFSKESPSGDIWHAAEGKDAGDNEDSEEEDQQAGEEES